MKNLMVENLYKTAMRHNIWDTYEHMCNICIYKKNSNSKINVKLQCDKRQLFRVQQANSKLTIHTD